MINRALLALGILFSPVTVHAASYGLDPGHTEIRFIWDHAGVSEQSGEWGKVEGTVDFDPEDIAATKVSITIDANSVQTGVEGLDKHMKAADMFDTEKFGTITFESTEVVQSGKDSVTVTGDLTIKDQTHPLVLDVELVHMGEHPVGQFIEYYEGDWLGVRATGRLLRSKYGVGYGAPLTSDLIKLDISAELKTQ